MGLRNQRWNRCVFDRIFLFVTIITSYYVPRRVTLSVCFFLFIFFFLGPNFTFVRQCMAQNQARRPKCVLLLLFLFWLILSTRYIFVVSAAISSVYYYNMHMLWYTYCTSIRFLLVSTQIYFTVSSTLDTLFSSRKLRRNSGFFIFFFFSRYYYHYAHLPAYLDPYR